MSGLKDDFGDSNHDEWHSYMLEVHARLVKDIPELAAGTQALGLGSQGMILDTHNGNVLKLFLRNDKANESEFQSEIAMLKCLGGQAYDTAIAPTLLEEFLLPNSAEAYAAYRMPKLSGKTIEWKIFEKTAPPEQVEKHFRNVGAVLASFHALTTPLIDKAHPPQKQLHYGDEIQNVPILGARVNTALSICNAYLQKHMEAGANHGDFNPANFFVDKDNQISHVFDFSFVGLTPNYLTDFAMIPSESAGFAVDEYSKITGKLIDPKILALTQMSLYAAIINYNIGRDYHESPTVIQNMSARLISHLNKVSNITGMQFTAADAAPGANM